MNILKSRYSVELLPAWQQCHAGASGTILHPVCLAAGGKSPGQAVPAQETHTLVDTTGVSLSSSKHRAVPVHWTQDIITCPGGKCVTRVNVVGILVWPNGGKCLHCISVHDNFATRRAYEFCTEFKAIPCSVVPINRLYRLYIIFHNRIDLIDCTFL